ncbi:MAG TPA: hypothetical protein VGQ93_11860, partial [Lysobacter sp.]|nr:hypothetical protein [Lysobacter sp.]
MQLLAGAGEGAAAVDGIKDLQGIQADPEHSNFSMIGRQTIRFPSGFDARILRAVDGNQQFIGIRFSQRCDRNYRI